tara:strand:- start:134 stop:1345 length:1212 start_codon:yes stop_codon:yes gene_type:complete
MKKHIILYGAFDRYNYGDNLMPVIFEQYIVKYRPEILADYQLVYASISRADLSEYKCPSTVSIEQALAAAPEGSALIVIGGEVLCASNLTLLLHMQKSDFTHQLMVFLKKALGKYLAKLASPFYGTPWEFPYIPPVARLPKGLSLLFNTVGGEISIGNQAKQQEVVNSLNGSIHLSVRDQRTVKELNGFCENVLLSPDSVFLIADLIDDTFLESYLSEKIVTTGKRKYISFQASPHKIKYDAQETARYLDIIAEKLGAEVVLLPIGYASGHDDRAFLRKVKPLLKTKNTLFDALNVWEIMFVIKHSQCFLGTSLHGIISAMAFNVPHFGINPNIAKVEHFLRNWSVAPFNTSRDLAILGEEIDAIDFSDNSPLIGELSNNSLKLSEMVKQNNSRMLDAITAES